MEQSAKQPIPHSLFWGTVSAITSIIFTLVVYMINKHYLVSFVVGSISIILALVFPILAVVFFRKENNGLLSFKEGFVISFVVLAFAAMINSIFQYILYNVIDPGLVQMILEETIRKSTELMEKFGSSQEDIDKTIESLQEQDISFTPKRLMSNYMLNLLFGAFLSLVISAILRKKPTNSDYTS